MGVGRRPPYFAYTIAYFAYGLFRPVCLATAIRSHRGVRRSAQNYICPLSLAFRQCLLRASMRLRGARSVAWRKAAFRKRRSCIGRRRKTGRSGGRGYARQGARAAARRLCRNQEERAEEVSELEGAKSSW